MAVVLACLTLCFGTVFGPTRSSWANFYQSPADSNLEFFRAEVGFGWVGLVYPVWPGRFQIAKFT